MENTFRKLLLRADEPPHPTITAIRDVCARIDAVESRFSLETDPDLIEGCIYELGSLRAQYRFCCAMRVSRELPAGKRPIYGMNRAGVARWRCG